jgi:PAS domain S-box-containing protein
MNLALGQRRIVPLFILVMALIQILVLAALGVNNYLSSRQQLYSELDQHAQALLQRLQSNLPSLLWNFEEAFVHRSLLSEMNNDFVNTLIIEVEGEVRYFYSNTEKGVISSLQSGQNFYRSWRQVLHYSGPDGSEDVGVLTLYANNQNVTLKLEHQVIQQFYQILFVTLFFVAVLAFLFQIAILKPLRSLLMAQHTFQSMGEAFVYLDLELRVFISNQAAQEVTGFSEDQLLGLSITNLIENEEGRSDSLVGALSGRRHWAGEAFFRSSSGKHFPVYANVSPVIDGDGQLVCFVVLFHDRSEQKVAEQALQQALDDAQVAAKTKARFLATMSHEIRTPMNGVIGAAQLLKDTELSLEQQEYLTIINKSGEALLALINNILDFSRLEADKMEINRLAFDLELLAQASLHTVAVQAREKRLELIFDYAPDCPSKFIGDEVRLRQVLVNLLGNAIKFTHDGTVKLKIRWKPQGNDAAALEISVEDQGIGISSEQQQSLFEEFSQADMQTTREYGGSGLGLAISQKLVHAMGGEIELASEPGEGSRFSVHLTLPLVHSALEPMRFQRRPRILYVDDDKVNRRIYARLLEYFGARVNVQVSAADAMETLHAKPDAFDLLLTDLNMPRQSGLDLIRAVRREFTDHRMKLVLFSSMGDAAAQPDPEEYSIDAVGSKLYTRGELFQLLRQVLGEEAADDRASSDNARFKTTDKSCRIDAEVLVAEDVEPNRVIVRRVLEKCGARVHTVGNGAEALHFLRHHTVDLVLMHCQMPEVDGYQATKRVRSDPEFEHIRAVPIIALTANVSRTDRDKCSDAGLNDVIAKPFHNEELIAVVRRCLMGHEADNSETSEYQQEGHSMVLNQETLRQILADMGEDAQVLLDTAHESLHEYLRLLRERDESTTQEDLTRFVHSMKSTFASLGGEAAYHMAASYEAELRNAQAVDIDELGDELGKACNQLFEAIERSGLGTFN